MKVAVMCSTKIGLQVWSKSNLNINSFLNGEKLEEASSNDAWIYCAKNKIPAWCNYNNEPKLGEIFGKIYNYWAVIDPRGIAPEGWRIATKHDWLTLCEHLGGIGVAGGKIKSINDWGYYEDTYLNAIKTHSEDKANSVLDLKDDQTTETIENNESGFTALPGGYRNQIGIFFDIGIYAYWWSLLNDKKNYYKFNCTSFYTTYSSLFLIEMTVRQNEGFSVRCIKC